MMTQEEFMEVQVLHAAGWTIGQIAEHVGYHPATVSGWLNRRSASEAVTPVDEQIVDERWRERIGGLLAQNASLQATSMMRIIAAEGVRRVVSVVDALSAHGPWFVTGAGVGDADRHRSC